MNRLGIPLPDSTRNWKLQPLAAQYPVVAKLLEYRTMQKALTSYGQNMIEFINPKTGRLHADFRQIGAPTGRFACTNPNIQQVPHAVEYRRCFMGHPEGRRLVIADYSQIELRILAEFSGDEGFINAFRSGADLHRVTAAQVFNVTAEQVSKEQRDFAKRLNFGVVYGIGAQRFSMMTGLEVSEAENVLRRYFATYRGLDSYLREAASRAVNDKEARTGSGRLVRFNYDPSDRQQVSMTQRNGKNAPIQGTSADILKRALRLLNDELRETSGQIVNIIHDEIVVEVDAAEAPDIAQRVERAMIAAGEEYLQTVPVVVESQIATEWTK
jgi:DNA polymerase-1